jgi:hypothetical protein
LAVACACRKCLSGSLGVEAQACPGAVPQANATQPIRVGVDPIASYSEALGQLARIDQARGRRRCGYRELREVLGDGIDLLYLECNEVPVADRQKFDLPSDERGET